MNKIKLDEGVLCQHLSQYGTTATLVQLIDIPEHKRTLSQCAVLRVVSDFNGPNEQETTRDLNSVDSAELLYVAEVAKAIGE